MKVTFVDQRHLDRSVAQGLSRVQAPKATANDNDVRRIFSCHFWFPPRVKVNFFTENMPEVDVVVKLGNLVNYW